MILFAMQVNKNFKDKITVFLIKPFPSISPQRIIKFSKKIHFLLETEGENLLFFLENRVIKSFTERFCFAKIFYYYGKARIQKVV